MEMLATSFSVGSAPAKNDLQTMRQKAEELESVFLNTLVSEMFASIASEGEFGGGYAEETWRGMQSEQYAASMARSGGIGIADEIMRSLLLTQENAQTQNAEPQNNNNSDQGSNS
ncbi:hypothetical protein MNBD_ALPHA11-301 [hydrothermal vent metagenome]|uniref:Flagellar protein FlgJ N-terminal domain-containing protein n=1 Tax=hydrothermal vent metagenome TaxID=652676 RepID=A0A3B0TWZ3_9ZZZZ